MDKSQSQKILKSILGVVIVLLPIINFKFIGNNEYILLTIVSIILSLFSIYSAVINKKLCIPPFSNIFFILLCIITLISTIFSSAYISNLYYIKWLSIVQLFLFFLFLNRDNLDTIYLFIVASGLFQVIVCILQLIGLLNTFNPNFRVTGLFFNPSYCAIYLSIPFLLSFNKTIDQSQSKHIKFIYILITLLFFITILLCKSRGTLLSITVSSIFLFIKSPNCKNLFSKRAKAIKYAFPLFLVLLLISLYYVRPASAKSRILIWKVSSNIIKEHPMIGTGAETFKAKYMIAQSDYFKENKNSIYSTIADNNYQSFNEFIRVACEQGFIGLIVFLLFLLFAIKYSKSLLHKAIVISFAFISFFIYTFDIYPYLFILVITLFLNNHITDFKEKKLSFYHRAYIILFSLIIIVASAVTFKKYKKANYAISESTVYQKVVPMQSSDYKIIVRDKTLALLYSKKVIEYAETEYSINLLEEIIKYNISTSEMFCDLGDLYLRKREYSIAEKQYIIAKNMVPGLIVPKEKLLHLYENLGDSVKIKIIANEILNSQYKVVGSKVLRTKEEARSILSGDSHRGEI